MIWRDGRFLYSGSILCSPTDVLELRLSGHTTRFVFPVPQGRIVEFLRNKNAGVVEGRNAIYKVNVKLKEPKL